MPALKYYDLASGTYKYIPGGMSQAAADARYVQSQDLDTIVRGGGWVGTLTFAGGWANVPDIVIPAAFPPPNTYWKVTAMVYDPQDGNPFVCMLLGADQTTIRLRVYHLRNASYSGSRSITIHWTAVRTTP